MQAGADAELSFAHLIILIEETKKSVYNEELASSLRTEMNTYLKNSIADFQSEIAEAQDRALAELDRQRSQIAESFEQLMARGSSVNVDEDFGRVVVEHLQIAFEDGKTHAAESHEADTTALNAQIFEHSARHTQQETLIAEQTTRVTEQERLIAEQQQRIVEQERHIEEQEKSLAAQLAKPDNATLLRDATNDISSQTTQSEILRALVKHANNFAARGAFFIVKSDHLVGWRVFGQENASSDETAREIFMPLGADTMLSRSIKENQVQQQHSVSVEDQSYLRKLRFTNPAQVVAVPLVVRGRGVAVLYADSGANDSMLQADALELLMRVAGLTVEVQATGKTATPAAKVNGISAAPAQSSPIQNKVPATAVEPTNFQPNYENVNTTTTAAAPVVQPEIVPAAPIFEEKTHEEIAPVVPVETHEIHEATHETTPETTPETAPETTHETTHQIAPEKVEPEVPVEVAPIVVGNDFEPIHEPNEVAHPTQVSPIHESNYEVHKTEPHNLDQPQPHIEQTAVTTTPDVVAPETIFDYSQKSYTPHVETIETVETVETVEPVKVETFTREVEPELPVPPPIVTRRASERNVELPIEVPDDERRMHNDARRFARLLVSEIKLYNEQKVKEGRQAKDLYSRLREAVDRSREMYDKRVSPQVAAKYDYFNFEIVNTLAEGDESRLGTDYPGATV